MYISSSSDSSDSSDDEYLSRARAWIEHNGPGESSRAREESEARPWLHGPECYHGCIHATKCDGKEGKKEIPDISGEPKCEKGCNHHYDCIQREIRRDYEEIKYYAPMDPYVDFRRHIHEFHQSKNLNSTQETMGPEPKDVPQKEDEEMKEEEDEEMEEEEEEMEEEEEEMEEEEEEEEEMEEGVMIREEEPVAVEEEEMGEEEMEEDVEVEVLGNQDVGPQNQAPLQGGPNIENHGFMGKGLLPDLFALVEEEDPQSDITDVDDEEPHYVISKDLFDELMRYLHGGGGPSGGANA